MINYVLEHFSWLEAGWLAGWIAGNALFNWIGALSWMLEAGFVMIF